MSPGQGWIALWQTPEDKNNIENLSLSGFEAEGLTGNPSWRCSAISLQRPLIMTPVRPRDFAPALIKPPHTALIQSANRFES